MNTQAVARNTKSTVKKRASPKKAAGKPKVVDVRVTNASYLAGPTIGRTGFLTFDSGRPFWLMIPSLIWMFLRICLMPLVVAKAVIETTLSALMLAIFAGIGAWAFGLLTNEKVAEFLTELGDRGLELSRLLGLPY